MLTTRPPKPGRKNLIVISVFQYHKQGSLRNFQQSTEVMTELLNLPFQPNTSIIYKTQILNEFPISSNMERVAQAEHAKKSN